MTSDKAPGHRPTRIMLAIAIIVTTIAVFALWSTLTAPPMFGGFNPAVLGLPGDVVLSVLAAAIALIGLAWTIRIFRGTPKEPPWRYRDR
jgi:hypothetical protein